MKRRSEDERSQWMGCLFFFHGSLCLLQWQTTLYYIKDRKSVCILFSVSLTAPIITWLICTNYADCLWLTVHSVSRFRMDKRFIAREVFPFLWMCMWETGWITTDILMLVCLFVLSAVLSWFDLKNYLLSRNYVTVLLFWDAFLSSRVCFLSSELSMNLEEFCWPWTASPSSPRVTIIKILWSKIPIEPRLFTLGFLPLRKFRFLFEPYWTLYFSIKRRNLYVIGKRGISR
jgi:hypothetical protein